jgi:hypothetical protein
MEELAMWNLIVSVLGPLALISLLAAAEWRRTQEPKRYRWQPVELMVGPAMPALGSLPLIAPLPSALEIQEQMTELSLPIAA